VSHLASITWDVRHRPTDDVITGVPTVSWETAGGNIGTAPWADLTTHVSAAMKELIAARDWLTVYQLPPYAHELNPVEMSLS
jgi:hypothetical protein